MPHSPCAAPKWRLRWQEWVWLWIPGITQQLLGHDPSNELLPRRPWRTRAAHSVWLWSCCSVPQLQDRLGTWQDSVRTKCLVSLFFLIWSPWIGDDILTVQLFCFPVGSWMVILSGRLHQMFAATLIAPWRSSSVSGMPLNGLLAHGMLAFQLTTILRWVLQGLQVFLIWFCPNALLCDCCSHSPSISRTSNLPQLIQTDEGLRKCGAQLVTVMLYGDDVFTWYPVISYHRIVACFTSNVCFKLCERTFQSGTTCSEQHLQ